MVLYNSCFERDKREFQKTFKKVLTLIVKLDIITNVVSGNGGIGRRARLRGVWLYHASSSLVPRTIEKTSRLCDVFFLSPFQKTGSCRQRVMFIKQQTGTAACTAVPVLVFYPVI